MVRIGSLVEVYGGSSGITEGRVPDQGRGDLDRGRVPRPDDLHDHPRLREVASPAAVEPHADVRRHEGLATSPRRSLARPGSWRPTSADTSTTHRHVSQISQTDWDFLRGRAQEIGFEIGVAQGKFFFRAGIERQAEWRRRDRWCRRRRRGEHGRRWSADADVPAEPAVVPAATQRGEHPLRGRGPRLRLREGRGRRRHRAAEDRHGQARRRSRPAGAGRIVHRPAVPDPDAAEHPRSAEPRA